jgi:signal transduction histidine kinase/CheY-like chemotaxis protein
MTETRILVVDDESGITRLCDRLLTRAGYQTITFTNPLEAVEYLDHEKVDLLLVDIRMPEISGFDLIHQARQHQPDMAVLVMTGFGTVETAIQALRQGVDGLLLKPFEKGEELVQAVRQSLIDNQNKRDITSIQTLRTLFDMTETFLSETNPEHLLELVLNAVCAHLHCEHAGFYRSPEMASPLQLVACRGAALPLDPDGLVERIRQGAAPLWVNLDGPGDPDLQSKLAALGLKSLMSTPLTRLNVNGVLYAARSGDTPAFRKVDLEMFLLLGRQAAIAMENASLYTELRAYVRQVEESHQALVRAEKMAAAGRLTASIAHEINNPLQAVQNCLHLATREDLSPKKRREYLGMAKKEMERLMTTVTRMLDFYRPGGVDPQPVDLVDLLKHVLGLLASQLEKQKIQVSTSFSSRLPVILAVGSQLEQVFLNLILNAYDAMPEGGELKITARTARDMIEILVQDTGPGIPPEDQSRIFEPFVSTKPGGTGLGLSISYGIIAAHGGSLDLVVGQGKGKGACFRVMLPVEGVT